MKWRKPKSNPWLVAIVVTSAPSWKCWTPPSSTCRCRTSRGSLSVSNDESHLGTDDLSGRQRDRAHDLRFVVAPARAQTKYFLICVAGFTARSSLGCGLSHIVHRDSAVSAQCRASSAAACSRRSRPSSWTTSRPKSASRRSRSPPIAIIIAPILGPVVGGYLTDTYSWHWIFLINVPIGMLTFFGRATTLVEDPP